MHPLGVVQKDLQPGALAPSRLLWALPLAISLLGGCISQSPLGATSQPQEFSALEREITVLYQDGNPIGADHYDRLAAGLDTFEEQGVAVDRIPGLRQKLESLRTAPSPQHEEPSPESGQFAQVEREIAVLYADGRPIGPEHYQRLNDRLDSLEQQGLHAGEIPGLRERLEAVSPERPSQGLTPAEQADMEIINQLPECTGQQFTVSPVDLGELDEITPLGNIGPPGHTLPTEHLYLHLWPTGTSSALVPLKAPGDIHITGISVAADENAPHQEDYTFTFALCKDVFGYFKHAKELSVELKAALDNAECEGVAESHGLCSKRILLAVSAGTVIGKVGHTQGNFDFGAYDYRVQLPFANPASYGDLEAAGFGRPRSLSIVCPLDLYAPAVRTQFYNKIQRTAGPRCGTTMQDVPGSLQGNWFYNRGRADLEWDNHLAFVHGNGDPSTAVISVANVFMDPSKWVFSPSGSGLANRDFKDVKPDGSIYCYDRGGSGRILVKMDSAAKIRIEHQQGSCSGSMALVSPVVYER